MMYSVVELIASAEANQNSEVTITNYSSFDKATEEFNSLVSYYQDEEDGEIDVCRSIFEARYVDNEKAVKIQIVNTIDNGKSVIKF